MSFDKERFAMHLTANAKGSSQRKCARWVRLALEAGGCKVAAHPVHAKDWGPTLVTMGFVEITVPNPDTYPFQKGDIVVLQPFVGGNSSGHIAGYSGKQWISDFRQIDIWAGPGYRRARPNYAIYRY